MISLEQHNDATFEKRIDFRRDSITCSQCLYCSARFLVKDVMVH